MHSYHKTHFWEYGNYVLHTWRIKVNNRNSTGSTLLIAAFQMCSLFFLRTSIVKKIRALMCVWNPLKACESEKGYKIQGPVNLLKIKYMDTGAWNWLNLFCARFLGKKNPYYSLWYTNVDFFPNSLWACLIYAVTGIYRLYYFLHEVLCVVDCHDIHACTKVVIICCPNILINVIL